MVVRVYVISERMHKASPIGYFVYLSLLGFMQSEGFRRIELKAPTVYSCAHGRLCAHSCHMYTPSRQTWSFRPRDAVLWGGKFDAFAFHCDSSLSPASILGGISGGAEVFEDGISFSPILFWGEGDST